jgi:hypothetical protein
VIRIPRLNVLRDFVCRLRRSSPYPAFITGFNYPTTHQIDC